MNGINAFVYLDDCAAISIIMYPLLKNDESILCLCRHTTNFFQYFYFYITLYYNLAYFITVVQENDKKINKC